MQSHSSGQSKSYDRLHVPDNPQRRRTSLSPDYENTVRRIEKARSRSNTLQYKFDFSRQTGSAQGAHKRLSAAPNVVVQPSEVRKKAKPAPVTQPKRMAQPQSVQHKPRASHHDAAGRPESSSVTDFQTVRPQLQQGRSGTIRAPRLSDPRAPGTLAAGRHNSGRNALQPASPPADTHSTDSGNKKKKASYKPISGSLPGMKGRPGKPTLNPARGGSDQSASTVVGFDISRKVFEKNTPGSSLSVTQPTQARVQWSAQRFKSTSSIIFLIVAIFVMLAVSLMLSASVSDVVRRNEQLESDNAMIMAEISRVNMQIALEEDLSSLKERASQLGLTLPDESQIEYVQLEDDSSNIGRAEEP